MKIRKFLIQSIFVVIAFVFSASFALADNYYDVNSFFTDSKYASEGQARVSATLRHISDKAYFYIENNYWKALEESQKQSEYMRMIENIAEEFDNNIYPNLTNFYGKPWEPGIDNNIKTTFLLVPLKDGFGGYFSSSNEYRQIDVSNSNEREMVYINASYVIDPSVGFGRLKSFFAHEFTHLIIFFQKDKTQNVSNDVWFHEMLAEYSSSILSYDSIYTGSNLEQRVKVFMNDFSDSLGEWENKSKDYAIVMMLAQYFNDRELFYVLKESFKNNDTGIESIDRVFTSLNLQDRFSDIFMDFAMANYINDVSQDDGKYGYKDRNLKNIKLAPSSTISLNSSSKILQLLSLEDWSLNYYKFDGFAKTVKLTFDKSAESDIFKIGIIVENTDGTKTVQKIGLTQNNNELYLSGLGTAIKNFTIIPIAENKKDNFTDDDPSRLLRLSVESTDSFLPIIYSLSQESGFAQGGDIVNINGDYFDSGARVYFGDAEGIINRTSSNFIEVVTPSGSAQGVEVKVVNTSGVESNSKAFRYFNKQSDGSLIRAIGDYRVFIVKDRYIRHIKDAKIFSFYGHLGFDKVIEVPEEELGLYKESNLVKSEYSPMVYELENVTKHWLDIAADRFSATRSWDAIYLINQREFDFYQNGVAIKN